MADSRMLPAPVIKSPIGGWLCVAADAEQRAEGVERIEPPVEAEREFVQVGLKVLAADAVTCGCEPDRHGMKVVCVNDEGSYHGRGKQHRAGIKNGCVYEVSALLDRNDFDELPSVELVEVPGWPLWRSRFRPLTDISFAHEILRTVTETDPAFERAMAEAYPDRLPEYVRERT